MLVKFTHDKKNEWDLFLETCVFAFNTSKHESSLHIPFELMFGRRALIPIDVETEKNEGNELLQEYLTNTSVS